MTLNELLKSDKARYGSGFGLNKPLYYKWQICFRKASFYPKKSIRGIYYRLKLKILSERSGIQIPTDTCVGEGLFLGHNGRIIINSKARIGKNVNIATGVTIGKTNRGDRAGTPVIGNKVWIGTNAIIVGGISIGDDVMIAPGAYVNFDIPAHSIVLGNPGKIYFREYATEGYINNLV